MKSVFSYGLVALTATACVCPAAAWGQRAWAQRGRAHGVAVVYLSGGPVQNAQGYLGVDVRDVTEDRMVLLKLKDTHGAEITLVDHDGPAGKAGLREHDVVLQMNGQPIDGKDQIHRMLHGNPPGRTIVLLISRDGQPITVTTQLANQEEVEREAWERHMTVPEPVYSAQPSESFMAGPSVGAPVRGGNSFMGKGLIMNPSYTGAMLEMMSPQLADFFGSPSGSGLLVRSVEPNSPAALAGMRAGDIVLRANAQGITSSSDWTRAIQGSRGRVVTIVVLRERKEQTLSLTPDGKKRSSLERPVLGSVRSTLTD
jgi:serine protease Do